MRSRELTLGIRSRCSGRSLFVWGWVMLPMRWRLRGLTSDGGRVGAVVRTRGARVRRARRWGVMMMLLLMMLGIVGVVMVWRAVVML